MSEKFRAMIVEKGEKGYERRIGEKSVEELPEGELVVRVRYSSLNFKDALSAIGNKGVTRNFPHTPGIDAAGEVVECSDSRFSPGDIVLVTGYDLGMNTSGGYGEYIRIPSGWALPIPSGLNERSAMALGTAGFTAGLSVYKLMEAGVTPDKGGVIVTGATGGVGSIAVSILAAAGFSVTAVTGKPDQAEFLKKLGAEEILGRDELMQANEKMMSKTRWAGAVDVVGGDMLSAVLKSVHYLGAVTCCGLVGSPELNTNVFPFILRGVSLIGIDSVECPMDPRKKVWEKLSGEWLPENLEDIVEETDLDGLSDKIDLILKGGLKGRVVVDMG
ncbi:YhdH/YhfP family quinone oxidoreductase [Limisalsivibrio acetivorans]|uniref:YhdH/YhfP family quinone oxidoreductase n=1 Tax=Limisalsivibrio acetivorans TaxID=1304888 RepID=UPI0003B38F5A|nr:YhdH/YhfP family quinone oxidoreductase [Limisalsivibrio acetivorans]